MPPLVHQDLVPRDLDPKQDPALAEINRRFRELYTALNTQAGYHGPVSFANHINLNGNLVRNMGTPVLSTDGLSQKSADPMYSTPVQRKTMEIVGSQMLQSTRRLNDGTQQHRVSSDLNQQGAIPPTLTDTTNYTATATTVTVTFPATIQYGDQSIIAIPNTPVTITGLVTGTTYYIYPYYDTVLGIGTLVADSVNATGVPPVCFSAANANAAQMQTADGHVPLSNGGFQVSPVGGGHGGGGGSNCIRAGMVVETKERGVIAIETVYVGDMIRARSGWTRVTGRRTAHSMVFIRLTMSNGESLDVTPSHPISLFNGGEKEAGELTLGDVLCGPEGVPLQILSLLTVEETAPIVLLSCDPTHEYLVGKTHPMIVAHNFNIPK